MAALAPSVEREFHIDDQGYGFLVSAFSLAYAFSSPAMGYFLDRAGLNRAAMLLVGLWSAISAVTGVTRNYAQLVACRIGLGIAESGGIPAVAKVGALYLPPEERALGSALGQIGITLGATAAPLIGVSLAVRYGWRFPFFITGALGLLWIPVWAIVSNRIRPATSGSQDRQNAGTFFDRRLVLLVVANAMWMGIYSLWTNWTTLYLQRVHHLSLQETARYAWVPPLASNLGAFLGGWLALRWIRQGKAPIPARIQVLFVSSLGCLFTLLVPLATSPKWAVCAISLGYFWTLAGSVNIYTIPIDIYGAARAGTAISTLVFAYGMLQTFISPVIGKIVMTHGYDPVCWMVSLPPIIAWFILRRGLNS